jgi:glycosyltransferase involved in cell wall biosynthesis
VKICLVNTNRAWGGGEKWHCETALELKRRGHDVTMAVYRDSHLFKKVSKELRTVVFSIGKLSFLNPTLFLHLKRFFRQEKFDAVILNLPADVKAFAKPAYTAGVRKVIYRRGMNHPIKASAINRYFYTNYLTDIIANSQDVKKSVFKNIRELESKITVIPNGVTIDQSIVHTPARKPQLLIGNLGRLVEQKGQEDLIELGTLLRMDNQDFHIYIGGEGNQRQKLESAIEEKDLEEYVTLLGEVSPEDFFPKIDYFVFPSRFEGFSNAILEAMQYGKPVFCYDVASNTEIIENGKNGFVFEPFKVSGIKEKLLELRNDEAHYRTVQNEGLKRLKERYTFTKTIDQLEELFSS